jgi:signal transduction histidine kinase
MLSTLRQRLILSHALPMLVVIPVVGIALIYVLETRVLIPDLARELVGNAAVITKVAQDQPGVWEDPAQARIFVETVSEQLAVRVMLLDTNGRLIASSDRADAGRLGQPLDRPLLPTALAGEISVSTTYSPSLHAEITDVWAPVLGTDQQVVGIIRLSHRLASVREQFLQLRYLTLGVLTAALLLGTVIGLLLAWNMERPLRQATEAIFRLASGQHLTPLSEQGPEEMRILLRAFNTLVQRLHELEQARRQLLANLVHELGRPLGALRAAIHALRKGAVDDIAIREDLLAGMDEETERLQHLLDDLAQLHDQVLGTLELDRHPIDLSTWLSHVLAPWREAARKKELRWDSRVPTDLPTLRADADRLARALGNLVSNAIKYTPSGGVVSVEAGADNGAIWIRVSDTGPGIAPEEQARIFTPFYRGRQAGRFPRGMGLGLTIARDLVVAHGGRLEVASTPGKGSHFTMWVPLTPASDH